MPRRNFTGSTLVTSWPSTVRVPDVGSIIRLIIRIEVVLPQPDGPTNTASLPLGASSGSWSTATVPSGYSLMTLSKVIMCSFLKPLVETVVLHPFTSSLVGVDARVSGYLGVEVDEARGGQLG